MMVTMTVDTRTHPLRLAAAAVQPILLGWASVVILGIFSYTLMADSPALGSTTWQDVAAVSTGWWMTAFGGTLHFDGVGISLPPLTITLLTYLASFAILRRHPVKDWIDVLIVCATSGGTAALIGLLAPTGSYVWPAGLGAGAVALLAVLTSKNRSDWFAAGIVSSPAGRAIYDGLMLARRGMATALVLAVLALVTSTVLGWSEILKINGYYIVEWHSGLMMWLLQLAYLPTLILWSLAYIIGAGFAVGAGTAFSALGITAAPLPAIPILGALPQPGDASAWLLAIVAVALLIQGIRQARAFPDMVEVFITGLIQIAFTALIGALLAVLAQGSIGPDRLAVVGPEALTMALHGAVVIGVPLVLGMIIGHRSSVAAYRSWMESVGSSLRGLRNGKSSHGGSEPLGGDIRMVSAVANDPLSPDWPDRRVGNASADSAPASPGRGGPPRGAAGGMADEEGGGLADSEPPVHSAGPNGEKQSDRGLDGQDWADVGFYGEAPTPPTPATAQTAAEPGLDRRDDS